MFGPPPPYSKTWPLPSSPPQITPRTFLVQISHPYRDLVLLAPNLCTLPLFDIDFPRGGASRSWFNMPRTWGGRKGPKNLSLVSFRLFAHLMSHILQNYHLEFVHCFPYLPFFSTNSMYFCLWIWYYVEYTLCFVFCRLSLYFVFSNFVCSLSRSCLSSRQVRCSSSTSGPCRSNTGCTVDNKYTNTKILSQI